MQHRFDIVGDVHGQLAGLRALGHHLGYDVDRDWSHADDRVLVFVGDLIDRGEDSLGVAELVMNLVHGERAVSLMGNHEYNLVSYMLGLQFAKKSNRTTLADVQAQPERWVPVIEFFRTLPLALDLPDLRVIHAVWHLRCFAQVVAILHPGHTSALAHDPWSTVTWLQRHVVLSSPFGRGGLVPGLPSDAALPLGEDRAHEVLIRGYETEADKPLLDSDRKEQKNVRVTWWDQARPEIPHDKLTVFGHCWNLPPIPGWHDAFAPPYPSGYERLKAWQRKLIKHIPTHGLVNVPSNEKFVCIDYNGVFDAKAGSCIGAYRWPEHQVAWIYLPS